MIDVAHAAVDNGAELALAAADAGGDAAEIGAQLDALHHDDIAGLGEIMRFDFAKSGNAGFDPVWHGRAGRDIAHRQRAADQARAWIARHQNRGRNGADDAELVHDIGGDASEIRQGAKAVDNLRRHEG